MLCVTSLQVVCDVAPPNRYLYLFAGILWEIVAVSENGVTPMLSGGSQTCVFDTLSKVVVLFYYNSRNVG